MFPDSDIARSFKCGESKSRYLTTFGIVPHFGKQLSERVKEQNSGFVLLFDESLNHKSQFKQMDIHIRNWDQDNVITRFYTSEFMGHATAQDMLDVFHTAIEGLNRKFILQLSMDGPSVNWKFHKMVNSELEKDVNRNLINLGSCGLHIVHGAFKKGVDALGWNADSFISSAYWLFKDSPARSEDYCKAIGVENPLMPEKFCKTRWVENVTVTERLNARFNKIFERSGSRKVPKPGYKELAGSKRWMQGYINASQACVLTVLCKRSSPLPDYLSIR